MSAPCLICGARLRAGVRAYDCSTTLSELGFSSNGPMYAHIECVVERRDKAKCAARRRGYDPSVLNLKKNPHVAPTDPTRYTPRTR